MNLLLNSARYDTYVNKFVKHFTEQEKLEDYQRVLLAPANGIENVINFFCSLLTQEGRTDIVEGIQNITESPEVLKDIWEVFYDKLTPTQKLTVGIEYGANVFVLGKVVSRILKILTVLAKRKGILLSGAAVTATSSGAKIAEDIQDFQSAVEADNL